MKVTSIYALILLILIYFHNDYAIDTFIGYVIGTVLLYKVAVGAESSSYWCTVDSNLNHLILRGKRMRECVGEFESKIQNPKRKVNKSEMYYFPKGT